MVQHNVLVTGAAGFIGSHVADALEADGFHVVGLDDLSTGNRANVPAAVEFVQGSIGDAPLVASLFEKHRFRYVFHLAAYAAEGLSHFIRRFNYENNVVGSMTIINESVRHAVECLVFTSSIAVYGRGQMPVNEATVPQPEDPYGIAKYTVELDLEAARQMFGLDYIVFRPHNVYGERQNISDRYRNVIGIFMNQLMRGEPMTIFGDGEQTRAFSHIDDVAPVMARSIHEPRARNNVFNIGADRAVSVGDLATVVAEALGRPRLVRHLPPRHEVVHAFADHSKLHGLFPLGQPLELADGLRRMAAWAQTQGPLEPSAWIRPEVDKHLPPSWQKP